jgi:predicted membrane chloride channel (bestrophin family)
MAIIELIYCATSVINPELFFIPIFIVLAIAGIASLCCSSEISKKLYMNLVGTGISLTFLANFILQYYVRQKTMQPPNAILTFSIIWFVIIILRTNRAYSRYLNDKKYSKKTGKS